MERVNATVTVHPDMKGQSGAISTFGVWPSQYGNMVAWNGNQVLNRVGVSGILSIILWS